MYPAPSFFLGTNMKYYNVRASETTSRDFCVKAESNDEATDAVQRFLLEGEKATPEVIALRCDTSTLIDVSEATETEFNDTAKRYKKKKGK